MPPRAVQIDLLSQGRLEGAHDICVCSVVHAFLSFLLYHNFLKVSLRQQACSSVRSDLLFHELIYATWIQWQQWSSIHQYLVYLWCNTSTKFVQVLPSSTRNRPQALLSLPFYLASEVIRFCHWETFLWFSVFLRMTLLAFWPQYVRDLKCLQPSKYEFNKYVNQSMFIYSLAELKSPDSSQKHSICHFKWPNTSVSQTPGDQHW